MKLSEINMALAGSVLTSEATLDHDANTVFASDLMSDVLAYGRKTSILVTGLCNVQIIRTAEMMDCCCIILARNKVANEQMISTANDLGICLISSEMFVYDVCNKLGELGLIGGGEYA